MIPFLTAAELRDALPYPALIEALRAAFQSAIQAPTRHVHQISEAADSPVLLLMPAWQAAEKIGVKLLTVAPGNAARGIPTVHSIFILFDAGSGVPLALLDGEELTLRRTGAASALASGYLSRADSSTLLLVGTGQLAPYLAAAHCAVRPIRHIRVWGRDQKKTEATVQQLRQQDLPDDVLLEIVEPAPAKLEAAARQADIISCATTSRVPLILGDWLQAGTHLDLVGGFKPDMRESDDRVMQRATIFVDTFAGTLAEAGDLLQPMAAGTLQRAAIVAELADLAGARHPGRTDRAQITVFKSVGTAIEDLSAANLAWARHAPNPLPSA
jgi:ornithine cyclodeaminase/alanine dehydrogenase-like protein (mu-crystallin family)